ncbi:MAG TPA: Mut7-C RNAse domain-containing protein [Candidatus Udaeobacter sp.]
MRPFRIRLKFHGDLPFFLGAKTRRETVERALREKTSVKDVIESCGVPHPEVDLILVDGQPVDFHHTLRTDADVDVYPVGLLPTYFTENHLQVTNSKEFVADGHLGKLARDLRLLGFDIAYDRDADDRQLLATMRENNRALLTRDRRLLMHAIVQHGYYLRSQNPIRQTIEVLRRFALFSAIAPFTRCLRCNAPLQKVAKANVIQKLEPLTKIYYEQFRRCTGCDQIYWAGSHFSKLQKRLEEIRANFSD